MFVCLIRVEEEEIEALSRKTSKIKYFSRYMSEGWD
jgi:hypothetical protein